MDSSILIHRVGGSPTVRIDRRTFLLGAAATSTAMLLPGVVAARQATPAHEGHGASDLPEVELVRTAEGIGAMSAGHAMWLELDLAADTYMGACFLPTPDGTPHAKLGMLTAFEVE